MKLSRYSLAVPLAAALLLTACGDDDDDTADTAAAAPTITLGAADFAESQLLAEIYGQALENSGQRVARKDPIGSRELYFQAISDNEIQLVPEYTGNLLNYVLASQDPPATATAGTIEEQVTELAEALPENLTAGAPSSAEDKDVIVCRKEIAEQYSLTNLTELQAVMGEVTLGAPPELAERQTYGPDILPDGFKSFTPLLFGEIIDALTSGAIDCGSLFSTTSQITTEGFVPLDDEGRVAPQAVLPLLTTEAATPDVLAVLDGVSGQLTTDALKAMMVRIEVDKEAPDVVAKAFLAGEIEVTESTTGGTSVTETTAGG
jgi:osmoprotectant transport system substrate-binding protein